MMLGKYLQKVGEVTLPVTGKIHDALYDTPETTGVASPNIQGAKNDATNDIWYKTVTYYAGGMLVCGLLFGMLVMSLIGGKTTRRVRRRAVRRSARRTYTRARSTYSRARRRVTRRRVRK